MVVAFRFATVVLVVGAAANVVVVARVGSPVAVLTYKVNSSSHIGTPGLGNWFTIGMLGKPADVVRS